MIPTFKSKSVNDVILSIIVYLFLCILSTTSLAIGVAAASLARDPLTLATLAGLVAGALSMAAGEYVSVSSQVDIETADLKREKYALTFDPEIELIELSTIYENRGLTSELAIVVANQLTNHNALDAHARDELGIHEITRAKPLQAAIVSAASFLAGGILPLLLAVFALLKQMILLLYVFSFIFLLYQEPLQQKLEVQKSANLFGEYVSGARLS